MCLAKLAIVGKCCSGITDQDASVAVAAVPLEFEGMICLLQCTFVLKLSFKRVRV